MDTFFSDHWELAAGGVSLMLGIIGFFFVSFFKRVIELEREVKEIKMNYLNRFTQIERHVTEESKTTREEISGLRVLMATLIEKQDAQTKFCTFIQEQKDKIKEK